MRYNKYGNHKRELDGYKFDSIKEMNRYSELKLLKRGGVIKNLRLQPRYELQEGFTYQGKKERKIEYVADFEYTENSKTVVEDVKGMKTDVYKLKRKLFLYRYPDLTFYET